MRRALLPFLGAAAILAGCNNVISPFVTTPRAAQPGVVDPGPQVAICFNKLKTPDYEVQRLAQAECYNGGTAELVDTDYRVDNCPLLTPGRATFVCRPKK